MKKNLSYSMLFTALTLCSVNASTIEQSSTKSDIQIKTIDILTNIAKTFQHIPASYHDKLITAQDNTTTSNQDLIALVTETTQLLNFNAPDFLATKDQLLSLKRSLIAELEDFKITGFSFAIDPNLACIVETRNPKFSIDFIDSKGQKRSKDFELTFDTVGLKLQIGVNIDAIFFVNTDLNFYTLDKEIKLGTGIEVSSDALVSILSFSIFGSCLGNFTPDLNVAYIPFQNVKGGIVIASLAIFSKELFTIITGGTLKPAIDNLNK